MITTHTSPCSGGTQVHLGLTISIQTESEDFHPDPSQVLWVEPFEDFPSWNALMVQTTSVMSPIQELNIVNYILFSIPYRKFS